LLANFENRLLVRTVSVDWIGVAPALVGIGIASLTLADQFNFLKPYAVPGGIALILAGLRLCRVPICRAASSRRRARTCPPDIALEIEDCADDAGDLARASDRVQQGESVVCRRLMHWRLDYARRHGIHADAAAL
jgi:hypothetical protein